MPTSPQTPQQTPNDAAKSAQEAEAKKIAADKPLDESSPSAKFLRAVIGAEVKKPEPKPKPEPEEKPAPKKKATPPPPPAPTIDENKLGAAIGRSLAEHTKSEGREKAEQKQEEKPTPSEEEAKDARKLQVLAHMEKLYPERYKGIAQRYKTNQTTLRQRAAAWEKDHPGESYADMLEAYEANPEENPDFEAEARVADELDNSADWEDDDYIEALADIRVEKRGQLSPREDQLKLDERLSEVERAEKTRKAQEQLRNLAFAAGNEYWKGLGDDFAEVVNEDGSINRKQLQAINESDPVRHDIAVSAAKDAEMGVVKIHMLANGMEKWNPRDQSHVAISEFAHRMEQEALAKDPNDQFDDEGKRRFTTKAEFIKMTPEQQERHFIFTEEDLKALWVRETVKRAKQILQAEDEKFSRRARAKGLIRDDEETTARSPRKPTTRIGDVSDDGEDIGDDDSGKPVSPGFSASPKLAAGKAGSRAGGESGASRFITKLIG